MSCLRASGFAWGEIMDRPMFAIKAVVVGLGLAIVASLAVLVAGILGELGDSEDSRGARFGDVAVALPADARGDGNGTRRKANFSCLWSRKRGAQSILTVDRRTGGSSGQPRTSSSGTASDGRAKGSFRQRQRLGHRTRNPRGDRARQPRRRGRLRRRRRHRRSRSAPWPRSSRPGVSVLPVGTGSAANGLAIAFVTPPWGAVCTCHEDFAHRGRRGERTGVLQRRRPASPRSRASMAASMSRPCARAAGAFDPADVHHPMPATLSITQATEQGTLYSPRPDSRVGRACRRARPRLPHGRGAVRQRGRGAGLRAGGSDLEGRRGRVVVRGATKNGCLAAEALGRVRRLARKVRDPAAPAQAGRPAVQQDALSWPGSSTPIWPTATGSPGPDTPMPRPPGWPKAWRAPTASRRSVPSRRTRSSCPCPKPCSSGCGRQGSVSIR